MFGKKILFLTAGYVAGSIIGSLYKGKKKSPSEIKTKGNAKQLAENFLEVQKNFIDDIEKRFLSENGREKIDTTKKKFHEYADKYLQEGEKLLTQLQANDTYAEAKKKGLSFFEKLSFWKRDIENDVEVEVENLEAKAKQSASNIKRTKEESTK